MIANCAREPGVSASDLCAKLAIMELCPPVSSGLGVFLRDECHYTAGRGVTARCLG
jgi:hypothetical protein